MKITASQIESLVQNVEDYEQVKVVSIYFPVRGFEVISHENNDEKGIVVSVYSEDLDIFGNILISDSVGLSIISTSWSKADLTVVFGRPKMYFL